jgi:GTPase
VSAMKAFVLLPVLKNKISALRTPEERMEEAIRLTCSIGLEVVEKRLVFLREIKPQTYIGGGVVQELFNQIQSENIEVLIADCALSPLQQRNLEKALKCKVIDRTALILEIFGQRARTKEGALQVEVAHLTYQRSRLVRSWTHLERQRGGTGFLGGPGEKQIEMDRRLIDEKLVRLKKELENVKKTRSLQRVKRQKVPFPVVALVGYTNAGKSTLFNALTHADVYAKDQLFATLDPTIRQVELPSGQKILLSDTVGFISELPTELVAAFRATLEEVLQADVLLHIRDASSSQKEAQKKDVEEVLKSLGLKEEVEAGLNEVYNKIDLVDDMEAKTLKGYALRKENILCVSALTGEGLKDILSFLDKILAVSWIDTEILIRPEEGKELAWLYEHGRVETRLDTEEGICLKVKLRPEDIKKLEKRKYL